MIFKYPCCLNLLFCPLAMSVFIIAFTCLPLLQLANIDVIKYKILLMLSCFQDLVMVTGWIVKQ